MGLYKQEFIEDRKHEDVFLLWKPLLRLGEEDKLSHVCPFYHLGALGVGESRTCCLMEEMGHLTGSSAADSGEGVRAVSMG